MRNTLLETEINLQLFGGGGSGSGLGGGGGGGPTEFVFQFKTKDGRIHKHLIKAKNLEKAKEKAEKYRVDNDYVAKSKGISKEEYDNLKKSKKK